MRLFLGVLFIIIGTNHSHATDESAEPSKQQQKFSNESEVSLIQSGGNSNVETYNMKTLTKMEQMKSIFSLSGHYTVSFYKTTDDNGDSVKAESARNWDLQGKYEHVLNKKINGFFAAQYEGDEFSGFKQRENIDIGGKYTLVKTKKVQSFAEVGARYTTERNVQRDLSGQDVFYVTKARMYLEHNQEYSEALSWKVWVEYLPNFTNSDDYIVSYGPSLTFLLSSIFSLKTAYKVIYDNQPNLEGNEQKDFKLTTSLVARF